MNDAICTSEMPNHKKINAFSMVNEDANIKCLTLTLKINNYKIVKYLSFLFLISYLLSLVCSRVTWFSID